MTGTLEKRVENFKRIILCDALEKCTESQIKNFSRIYPSGVSEVHLDNAIKLCERTVQGNEQRAKEEFTMT